MATALEIVINAKDNASSVIGGVTKSLGGLGSVGGVVAKGLGLAVGAITAVAGAAMAGVGAFVAYASQATMAAGRVDEMRIVNDVLAKNLGISTEAVRAQVQALRDQGIAAGAAEDALAKMMQANLDIAYATDIANVAQNAAVIGGINSSEAYDRIIHGITTLQPEVLRSVGLVVDQGKAFDDLAASLGKSVTNLTAAEKQQAMMNAVLAAGVTINGAYDAAMSNPIKQLGSMKRLFDDLAVSVGNNFLPGLSTIVSEMSGVVKWLIAATEEGGAFYPILQILGDNFSNLALNIGPIVQLFKEFSGVAAEALTALMTGDMTAFEEKMQKIGDLLLFAVNNAMPKLIGAATSLLETFVSALITSFPILLPAVVRMIQYLITGILQSASLILEAAFALINTFLQGIIQLLPVAIPLIIQFVMDLVNLFIENAPLILNAAVAIIMGLVNGIVTLLPLLIPAVIELLVALVTAITENLPLIINAAIVLLQAVADGIIQALPLLIPAVFQLIQALVITLMENIPVLVTAILEISKALATALIENVPLLVDAALALITAIIAAIGENYPLFVQVGLDLLEQMTIGILEYVPTLIAVFPEIISSIVTGLTNLLPAIWQAGVSIVTGLIGGIKSKIAEVIAPFTGIVDQVKSALGIQSPSKVFAEIGNMVGKGFEVGVDGMKGDIQATLNNTMTPDSLSAAGNTGGQIVINLTYAPAVSLGDREEAQQVLLPFIRDNLRVLGVQTY